MKSKQTHGVTEWFPSSIKPVRAGVYEVHTPVCVANNFAYYDKEGWRLCARTISDATKANVMPFLSRDMKIKDSCWRGLSSKP